jgi:hypothetical protein
MNIRSHFPHPNPGQPEFAQVSTGTPVDGVAVSQSHRAGIAGLARQRALRLQALLKGADW